MLRVNKPHVYDFKHYKITWYCWLPGLHHHDALKDADDTVAE